MGITFESHPSQEAFDLLEYFPVFIVIEKGQICFLLKVCAHTLYSVMLKVYRNDWHEWSLTFTGTPMISAAIVGQF